MNIEFFKPIYFYSDELKKLIDKMKEYLENKIVLSMTTYHFVSYPYSYFVEDVLPVKRVYSSNFQNRYFWIKSEKLLNGIINDAEIDIIDYSEFSEKDKFGLLFKIKNISLYNVLLSNNKNYDEFNKKILDNDRKKISKYLSVINRNYKVYFEIDEVYDENGNKKFFGKIVPNIGEFIDNYKLDLQHEFIYFYEFVDDLDEMIVKYIKMNKIVERYDKIKKNDFLIQNNYVKKNYPEFLI
jgi:hypothetical protein